MKFMLEANISIISSSSLVSDAKKRIKSDLINAELDPEVNKLDHVLISLKENSNIDQLISKIKNNSQIKDNFILRQQFWGGNPHNKQIIKEFIRIFNDTTADVIYETPNYKVWVGNYYTQLEADKRLLDIRKKFRSAFIFRPELQEIFVDEIDEELNQEKSMID